MSTALYRRYRPESFAEVIGQEHVTEPLMQALRSDRVHHAYLFSGPRGCGKTTSARIMARCLNCEQGPTPTPCGTCESCVAMARGGPGSVDVIEIDAASHGGVDDARDLRERAAFGPAVSRFKVYIIDEAHMVSNQGFNALLKVVEEPPEHVKFVFATTEPEKVISTIRSRTHHYPFHLVPPQRLTSYLEQLCDSEGVALEPGVLSFVTRAGGGSVRDSLSVLDQLIAGAGEEGLTYERTAALLGFTDVELLDGMVDAVGAGDAASVFGHVDRLMESGHDPRRFVEDLLERYRDLIVLTAVGERSGGLLRGLPEDQVTRMRQQAGVYGAASLSRCADLVNRGLSEMTGTVSARLHLELICARLLLPGAAGEEGHGARLDRLERRLAAAGDPSPAARQEQARGAAPTGTTAVAGPPGTAPDAPRPPAAARPTTSRPVADDPPAEPEAPTGARPAEPAPPSAATGALDTDAVRRAWPEVLEAIKGIRKVTWTLVSVNCTVLDWDGQRLQLGMGSAGLVGRLRDGVNDEVVRQALSERLGLTARVEGVVVGQEGPPAGGPTRSGRGGAGGGGSGRPAPTEPAPAERAPAEALTPEALGVAASAARSVAGPSWSSAAPAAAPAWATQQPEVGAEDTPATAPRSGRSTTAPAPSSSAPERPPAPSEPSRDDEDLEGFRSVGQPVIESVLGGTVISVDDETT